MCQQKRAKMQGIPPDLTVSELVEDKRTPGVLKLEDKLISDSKICRTLGMILNNNLSWEAHLLSGEKAVLPAARKQLGMLLKLKDNISQKVRLQLANSLILSKITYGICLWGFATNNYVRKSQILLNQSARFVSTKDRTTRQSELMSDCQWLNITELTEYHALLQMFKTVRWGAPKYLKDMITIETEDIISTKAPRLQLTGLSCRVRTVKYWNKLPGQLMTELNIGRFKKSVKRWIIDRRTPDQGQGQADATDDS